MNEITTVEQLRKLPRHAVILDKGGDAWQLMEADMWVVTGLTARFNVHTLIQFGPFRAIWPLEVSQ